MKTAAVAATPPRLIAVQLCSATPFKNHLPPTFDKLFPPCLNQPLKKYGTINLLKTNLSYLFCFCKQRKIGCHGWDLEAAGEAAVSSPGSGL